MYRLFLAIGLAGSIVLVPAARTADEKKDDKKPGVVVDKDKGTITIDCKIAPRKIDDPRYKETYPIEVVACWPFPKGEKAHETIVTIECKPSEVHKALEDLGLKAGKPAQLDTDKAEGPEVNIYLEFPGADDLQKRVPIEKTLVDNKNGKNPPKLKWHFTGSVISKVPDKDEKAYGADITGTLITFIPVTDKTVLQNQLTKKDEPFLKVDTDKKLLPKEGTAVKLIIEVPAK
jgi:hypothetical protein